VWHAVSWMGRRLLVSVWSGAEPRVCVLSRLVRKKTEMGIGDCIYDFGDGWGRGSVGILNFF
jgi:hypothetical protein